MKTTEQYEQMTKAASYQIMRALEVFRGEPEYIRAQGHQIIMQRVSRMLNGNNSVIDGEATEIKEPGQTEPINTPTGEEPDRPDRGEDEAV